MKKYIQYLMIAMAITATLCTYAQDKPLSVNSKVPPIKLMNIVNASFQSISSEDLKGKAIILDFWNHGCGTCLAKMPAVASLQQVYGDKVKFFLISAQDKDFVKAFYKDRPDLANLKLATVTGNKELRKWFPYATNPHVVWIGKDRVVKAITGFRELTDSNLTTLLETNKLDLPQKLDILDFDAKNKPLLSNGQQLQSLVKYSSTFTGGLQGIGANNGYSALDSTRLKVLALNSTAVQLYAFTYLEPLRLMYYDFYSKIFFRGFDTAAEERLRRQQFCYELIVPLKNNKVNQRKARNLMREQLDVFFGVRASIEKKDLPCYILSRLDTTSGTVAVDYKNGYRESLDSLWYTDYDPKFIAEQIKSLFEKSTLPVVFEGQGYPVTMSLAKQYSSIEQLAKELLSQGFLLTKGNKKLDILIIENTEASKPGNEP